VVVGHCFAPFFALTPSCGCGSLVDDGARDTAPLDAANRSRPSTLSTTNTGGTIYSTVVSSSFAANTTINVANDSGTLDAGLSFGMLRDQPWRQPTEETL
jgi:hypothetical protein